MKDHIETYRQSVRAAHGRFKPNSGEAFRDPQRLYLLDVEGDTNDQYLTSVRRRIGEFSLDMDIWMDDVVVCCIGHGILVDNITLLDRPSADGLGSMPGRRDPGQRSAVSTSAVDASERLRMWHCTLAAGAALLLRDGWQPYRAPAGSQCGNPAFLYVTNSSENARWYADEKAEGVVVELLLDPAALRVDPEDGIGDSVAEELEISARHGLPANLAISQSINAEAFTGFDPDSAAVPSPF